MVKKPLATQFAQQERRVRVIYVGSYIPRECGIATFTKDLTSAINVLNPYTLAEIMAIDEPGGETRDYPWEVKYRIKQGDMHSYIAAADYINQSSAEVINIQHEFGLFGGENGEYIIPFVENIKKPIITTLHTVLPRPNNHILRLTQKIAQNSKVVVVMIDTAAKRLVSVYNIPREKIVVIPHGVPDVPYGATSYYKKELGLGQNVIISSFGLINPGKGLEYAIKALPTIAKRFQKVKYLILGETHPNLVKIHGEKYRRHLEKLVHQLKLGKYVQFENRYLEFDNLIQYLRASDIYITPYLDPQQISSGTLAYAVGAGKPCISTPYLYAKEVLGKGRGMIVPFKNARAISQAVLHLLKEPDYKKKMEQKAYLYGRAMTWANVALKYLDLFNLATQ